MKQALLIAIILVAALPAAPALAQEPTPEFDMPYVWEPIELTETEIDGSMDIGSLIVSEDFINSLGSYAATGWYLLVKDHSSGEELGGVGILAYLLIFNLGVWVVMWIASFVHKKRIVTRAEAEAEGEGGEDDGSSMTWLSRDEAGRMWSHLGRELQRRNRF